MDITDVKIFPVDEEKLKAYVSIVLDDCFLVSDLKVIHGPNGLFISMPSKRKKNGEFKDIAHPLNRETRERIVTASTSAGERTLCASVTPPQPPSSVTHESSASWSRPQSAKTRPPAAKKKTSSWSSWTGCQPSAR